MFTPSVFLAVPEAAVETTPFKTDVDTFVVYICKIKNLHMLSISVDNSNFVI